MAISTVVKNFRDGTILIEDGTATTPLDVTVQFENGDFSLSGLNQGLAPYEITTYLDRGELGTVRKTNRTFATFSFTAHMTDIADGTEETLPGIILKQGAFSAAVSTLGANADVYTLKLTWTIEGTDYGDASDHVVTLDDCECTIDLAEGDPNTFTVNGTVYGTITLT